MKKFRYTGIDKSGSRVQSSLSAANERLAWETLKSRGITVVNLEAGYGRSTNHNPWYSKDIRVFRGELSYGEQAAIAGLLSTLFRSKITVPNAVSIAATTTGKNGVKRLLERVSQRIANGENLADSFEAENRLFSPIFVHFLRLGDEANDLPKALFALSQLLCSQNTTRQKVVSALIYPSILILAAVGLCVVMSLFVAPNLAPIFFSVGQDPPRALSLLLWTNVLLRDTWHIALTVFCLTVIGGMVSIQHPSLQSRLSGLKYRIPFLGPLFHDLTLARLVLSTKLLLASGETLPVALRSAGEIMGAGSDLGQYFKEAAEALESGQKASITFGKYPRLPSSFKELFRIGELTNTLEDTLDAVSKLLSEQVEQRTQRLVGLLTPAITLLLGMGVGLLVFSIMNAMLEINEIIL